MTPHLSYSKKITFLFLLFFFQFNIFLNGQNYYVPNDAHLIALNQRNDFHFSGTIKPFSESKKIKNLQLGYSPINHLGIVSSYFSYNHLKEQGNILNETKSKIWDAAIGGYLFFPMIEATDFEKELNIKEKSIFSQSGVVFDLYVGQSKGEITNIYERIGSNRFKIQKDYIQFGVHAKFKFLGIYFATRIGRLSFSDGIIQGKTNHSILRVIELFDTDSDFTFIEHSFRANVGIKYGQITLSVSRVNNSHKFYQLGVVNNVSSIGLNIDIDDFFRKR